MVRPFLKPLAKAPRPAAGRTGSGRLPSSRRASILPRVSFAQVLRLLFVVLPVLAIIGYSGRTLTRLRRKQRRHSPNTTAAGIQCVGWRHTLSCSPFGYGLHSPHIVIPLLLAYSTNCECYRRQACQLVMPPCASCAGNATQPAINHAPLGSPTQQATANAATLGPLTGGQPQLLFLAAHYVECFQEGSRCRGWLTYRLRRNVAFRHAWYARAE